MFTVNLKVFAVVLDILDCSSNSVPGVNFCCHATCLTRRSARQGRRRDLVQLFGSRRHRKHYSHVTACRKKKKFIYEAFNFSCEILRFISVCTSGPWGIAGKRVGLEFRESWGRQMWGGEVSWDVAVGPENHVPAPGLRVPACCVNL